MMRFALTALVALAAASVSASPRMFPIVGTVTLDETTIAQPTPPFGDGVSPPVDVSPSAGVLGFDNWTLFNTSAELPTGKTIVAVGTFATNPVSTFVKIAKRNAANNYTIVVDEPFSHPGGGRKLKTLSAPFVVPGPGYFVGAYYNVSGLQPNDLTGPSVARAAVQHANVSGAGQTLIEESGYTLPMSYAYSVPGAPPTGPPVVSTSLKTSLTYEIAPFVIVVVGQSNSAAFCGPDLYTVRHTDGSFQSINLATGEITNAAEPLPGVDGGMSAWASRLGDLLLDEGHVRKVVVVNIAQGGQYFSAFGPGGAYQSRIAQAKARLDALGLVTTHVLLGQGESDAASPQSSNVQADIQAIIDGFRAVKITAPIFVAKETWFGGSVPAGGAAVRAAQAAVVNGVDVFAGPDLDTIGNDGRIADAQRTHFNSIGLPAAATLWHDAMEARP